MTAPFSRRTLLAATVANSTWLLAGCAPYKHAGRGMAFTPWEFREDEGRPELLAARAAILAASPHNTQPWRFRVTEGSIEVHADLSRALGAMDSLRRELCIGLGCAIENAALTAGAQGRRVEVAYLPDSAAPTLVARLTLTPAAPEASPLEAAIPARKTNRFPYRETPLPPGTLAQLPSLIEDPRVRLLVITEPAERRELRQDSIDAVRAITRDPAMAEASHRWWRQTPAEVDAHRDGLNLDGLGLPTVTRWLAGTQSTVALSEANDYWVASIEGRQTTGAGFFILASEHRDRVEEQLATGRAYQRLALFLTHQGIDAQPLNMLPELQDREETTAAVARPFSAKCKRWLGAGGGGLQLLARFGYGEEPGFHSARRELSEVLCRDRCG